MGLFDFMKKKDNSPAKEAAKSGSSTASVNPASLESYSVKVANDQIPFHDCGIDMDVKLLVRAEFIFKGIKPDEGSVTEAGIQSFKDVFAQIEGQVPVKEFTKSPNFNKIKTALRESMIGKGFEVWSVSLDWMSYNKEFNEIVNGLNSQI